VPWRRGCLLAQEGSSRLAQGSVVLLGACHVLEHHVSVHPLGGSGSPGEVTTSQCIKGPRRSSEVRQVVVLIVELDFVIHPMVQQTQGVLKTGVDVVAELAADVHARSHRWALGLNIPGEGDCQDEGGGNVSTFYAKHRSLISLAVGTSLVTAYFTSKATFVQMFKCCEQDGAWS